ncbi:DMT family transporter [Sneathiella sp. HT1-7]|nr:DMT family transporter [Sneathiella sp. HT1-7]
MLLGLSFVGIRAIMTDQEAAASLGFLRYGLATLILLPLLWRRRIVMPPLKVFTIVALLGVLQFGLFHLFVNTALKDIPASRGAVIFALIPIMTMLIAAMAGRDTLNGIKLFAAVLSIVGVTLAIGEKAFAPNATSSSWTGEILFFLAVSCGATYNAFSGRLMQNRSVLLLTIIGMSAGTMVIFPVAYSEGIGTVIAGYDTQDWLWILYLAGPAAAFSLFIFNWGLKQLTPSQAAIYVPIAPIMAAAFGALILNEHLSNLFLVGLACAVAGPIIVNWRRS